MKKNAAWLLVTVSLILSIFILTACDNKIDAPAAKGNSDDARIEEQEGQQKEKKIEDNVRSNEPIVERYEDLLTLNQAYERGYLTKDNLLNIHRYYYDREEQYSSGLSDGQKLAIENTFVEIMEEEKEDAGYGDTVFTLDHAHVTGYYGTYNGCIAVSLTYGEGPFAADTIVWQEVVGDVTFGHSSYIPFFVSQKHKFENRVLIWKTKCKDDVSMDDEILEYYREPTLEENFEDDRVIIIFKHGFRGEVGFDTLEQYIEQPDAVVSIEHNLKTIYKGKDEKMFIGHDRNPMAYIRLSTHDKQTVIDVSKKLMNWDDVLVAGPSYIYEIYLY